MLHNRYIKCSLEDFALILSVKVGQGPACCNAGKNFCSHDTSTSCSDPTGWCKADHHISAWCLAGSMDTRSVAGERNVCAMPARKHLHFVSCHAQSNCCCMPCYIHQPWRVSALASNCQASTLEIAALPQHQGSTEVYCCTCCDLS